MSAETSMGGPSVTAIADAIAHRGPDDRGYFVDAAAGVSLAHNRLSIIDLTPGGHQPMASADGAVVLVYNGELYNFQALRRELEAAGQTFRSRSDSEVILASYLVWGERCVERFAGMFAFAIWNARTRRLFLARDALGMKPLYYTTVDKPHAFVFASEVKAFLSVPGFHARMDPVAVSQYMEFGYVFDAARTSFQEVFKLPPGHTMEVVGGIPTPPRPYFDPPVRGQETVLSWSEREEELHEALMTVVGEHLIADVDVGLLLSGGLDSSLIAAVASRHKKITTVSMGFAESSVDERPWAKRVADHIGSDHHNVLIEPSEVSDGLEEVVWYFDDLFGDWGTVSTRLLYRKCRELGLKVVLVGEGSDELWAGYPIFDAAKSMRGPRELSMMQLYRRYSGRRHGKQYRAFRTIMRRYFAETGGSVPDAVRLFEVRNQLPNNYVMKVDKASMSVSIEARAPFLDRRLAEIALRTPVAELIDGATNKRLLRTTASRFGLLPDDVAFRTKFGGSIAASWMDDSTTFRSYAKSIVLDKGGWADALSLRNAMTVYFSGEKHGYRFPHAISIFQGVAWRLLLLNLWSRRYGVSPA